MGSVDPIRLRRLLGPLIDEELLQKIPALLFTDSRSDLAAVIQSRKLQNIQSSAGGPRLGITKAEHNPGQSSVNHCASAHGTRFFGNIQRTVREPPITH